MFLRFCPGPSPSLEFHIHGLISFEVSITDLSSTSGPAEMTEPDSTDNSKSTSSGAVRSESESQIAADPSRSLSTESTSEVKDDSPISLSSEQSMLEFKQPRPNGLCSTSA